MANKQYSRIWVVYAHPHFAYKRMVLLFSSRHERCIHQHIQLHLGQELLKPPRYLRILQESLYAVGNEQLLKPLYCNGVAYVALCLVHSLQGLSFFLWWLPGLPVCPRREGLPGLYRRTSLALRSCCGRVYEPRVTLTVLTVMRRCVWCARTFYLSVSGR